MQIFNKTLTFSLLYFFLICYKYNKNCDCVKNAHLIFPPYTIYIRLTYETAQGGQL